MTLNVEQLIQESRDPRLHKLPLYARELIHDLARRLEIEHVHAMNLVQKAEQAANEATALLGQGPEDSDTFLELPRSVTDYSDDEEAQRPLGKGVTIEFRPPDVTSGEGFEVSLNSDGSLFVGGINHLAVVPLGLTSLRIETR